MTLRGFALAITQNHTNMQSIYLRYKNSSGDPWTVVPSLTSVFPSQPAGSLPLGAARTETDSQITTPCSCPIGDTYVDDHYILRAETAPIPQSAVNAILTFLLRYKMAAYHEVQYSGYGSGSFTNAELSLLVSKNENGMSAVSFRLAAAIADVI
jgi:hypothetical protein